MTPISLSQERQQQCCTSQNRVMQPTAPETHFLYLGKTPSLCGDYEIPFLDRVFQEYREMFSITALKDNPLVLFNFHLATASHQNNDKIFSRYFSDNQRITNHKVKQHNIVRQIYFQSHGDVRHKPVIRE